MTAQELQRETERLARQLDKLSRENNNRQMADAARALQQAAQNMQQQSQGGTPGQQQQAAQQALEQLQRAQKMLNQGRGGSMEDRLAQVQQQAIEFPFRTEDGGEIIDAPRHLLAELRRSAVSTDQPKELVLLSGPSSVYRLGLCAAVPVLLFAIVAAREANTAGTEVDERRLADVAEQVIVADAPN